jgi:signal transduction histidine kinase
LGFSRRLEQRLQGQVSERYLEAMHTITKNGEHLLHLINDILDISKVEAGKLRLDLKRLQVRPIVEEMCNDMRHLAERKGLTLNLLPGDADLLAQVDGLRFRQIVLNLLSNAIKYTEQGSITVSLEPDGKQLLLRVADTGLGISPANQQLIFNKFERVHEEYAATIQGTGLGLSLVWELVNMHHGLVKVESEEGKGSCFTVVLPLAE